MKKDSGLSLIELLLALLILSVGMLAVGQLINYSARSARSSALTAQFNEVGSILRKVVKFKNSCRAAFRGKSLVPPSETPAVGPIKEPVEVEQIALDGGPVIIANEEFAGLKVTSMAFDKIVQDLGRKGSGQRGWIANFHVKAVKRTLGSGVGVLGLSSDVTIPVFVDAANVIQDCD